MTSVAAVAAVTSLAALAALAALAVVVLAILAAIVVDAASDFLDVGHGKLYFTKRIAPKTAITTRASSG